MKMPKKRNKVKKRSITYRHVWYVNISNCVYWLDIHSVKVWWRYVSPNANDVLFYDITFGIILDCMYVQCQIFVFYPTRFSYTKIIFWAFIQNVFMMFQFAFEEWNFKRWRKKSFRRMITMIVLIFFILYNIIIFMKKIIILLPRIN